MTRRFAYILLLLVLPCFLSTVVKSQETSAVLRFTVLDEKGDFFPALMARDVRILRNKRPVQVVSFVANEERALEILFLIDASLSQERTLPDEKRAAEYFIEHVLKQGKDKVAVVSFTGKVIMRKDLTGDLAGAKEELGKIEFEPPADYLGHGVVARPVFRKDSPMKDPLGDIGATSTWDSIMKASAALANVKSDAGKAIILITDGVNTWGDTKLKECIAASIKNGIPVYSIGIGDDSFDGVHESTLKKISEHTGGLSIVPGKGLKDLGVLIEKLGHALRSGYEARITTDPSGKAGALTEMTVEIVGTQPQRQHLQIIQPKGLISAQ